MPVRHYTGIENDPLNMQHPPTASAPHLTLAFHPTLSDRFQEWEMSMELFNAKVKTPVRQWHASVAANQAPKSPERQALLEWAYESPELKTWLAADMQLYEHAVAVFRQQTSATLNVRWD